MSKLQKKIRKVIYNDLIANGIEQSDASLIATGLSNKLKDITKPEASTHAFFNIYADIEAKTMFMQNMRTNQTKAYNSLENFYFMFQPTIIKEIGYLSDKYAQKHDEE